MVRGYTAQVRDILMANGCTFVRSGKGDHEIWRSPHASRPVVVDGTILSRHTANAILKQAGLATKL
ncbi:type II toxin-antitoxin system HicA family toxin [Sphingomonas sp. 4RDLI-65]|uniref:type II toxin-antitoxin system HicA family toxin n=1 Tax=Sphingomonas sp. 4RDLI-65 TaxID=3111641 RepID=UPI003C250820